MKKNSLFFNLVFLVGLLCLPVFMLIYGNATVVFAAERGGTLRISVTRDAERPGNPTTMKNQSDPLFGHCALENLFRTDESGAPTPWLATDWKTDTDSLTITLGLRKGVKFHDGTDFNAAAAKWNLDRYVKSTFQELKAVKSIDIIDDYTIRLNLSRMDSLLLINLAGIPGMMISPSAYQKSGKTDQEREDWCNENPVGTGPFKFVSWKRDQKQIYERFDGYWQKGKPYLEGIEFHIIADPMTQTAAFMKKDVDIIGDLTPKSGKTLSDSGKYNMIVSKLPAVLYSIAGDSAHADSVFSNLKVRQAVWHAIDTPAICDGIGYGYWEPLTQFAPEGSWAYNPEVKGYPYNPEKAKKLLAEAGYPNGFETTVWGLAMPPFTTLLTAIQNYLSQVGIKAKVDLMDPGRWMQTITGGAADKAGGWNNSLGTSPWSCKPNEFGAQYRLLSREVHEKRYPSLYDPEEFQDGLERAVSAPDFETMQAEVHKLQKIGTEENCMVMWLFASKSIGVGQKYVHDTGLGMGRTFALWTPEDAWMKK